MWRVVGVLILTGWGTLWGCVGGAIVGRMVSLSGRVLWG